MKNNLTYNENLIRIVNQYAKSLCILDPSEVLKLIYSNPYNFKDDNHIFFLKKLLESVLGINFLILNNENLIESKLKEKITYNIYKNLKLNNIFNVNEPFETFECSQIILLKISEFFKIYIELKFSQNNNNITTQRSFYLSPSEDFKVNKDALHFIVSFEIFEDGRDGSNNLYKVNSWKILDAFHLDCDVKYEFNSDNRRMYNKKMILAEGKV